MGAAQPAPSPGGMSQEQRLEEAYRLSRGGRGARAGATRPRVSLRLRAACADAFEGTLVQLPASVMSQLVEDNPQGEHVYRVRSAHGSYCFAGVRDYSAPAGRAVLAAGLRRALGVAEGDSVELDLVNSTARHRAPLVHVPVATQLRLRWESAERYDSARELADSGAVALQEALERAVDESYPVLMLNDVVRFEFQGAPCELRVLGLRVRARAGDPAEGAGGGEEDEDLSRAIRESLAAQPPEAGEAEDVALGPGEAARLRVPPWEAFERRLAVEPPLGWVPPAPFPDAVWDPERQRYHPAGWRWDEGLDTYIAPARAVPGGAAAPEEAARGATGAEPAVAAAERGGVPPAGPGAGRALGGAGPPGGEGGDLSQEELRRRRAEALERLCRPSAPARLGVGAGAGGAPAPGGAQAVVGERGGDPPPAEAGGGEALGGAGAPGGEEGGDLSQEELRQRRADAMERRLLRHLSRK